MIYYGPGSGSQLTPIRIAGKYQHWVGKLDVVPCIEKHHFKYTAQVHCFRDYALHNMQWIDLFSVNGLTSRGWMKPL